MSLQDTPVVAAWMHHLTEEFLGRDLFEPLLRWQGEETPLFGTNHPMIQSGECLDGFDELGLDEETAEWFLRGNAERAFGVGLV